MRRIGFVVNPIAGLGGRVGLKGTDGVVDQALAAGAKPVAMQRAQAFAEAFAAMAATDPRLDVAWLVGGADMGENPLRGAGIRTGATEIVHVPPEQTTAEDTRRAVEEGVSRQAELILFCGGDGTARDVAAAVEDRAPIVGIPAGVKMHSGIFAASPVAAADLLVAFLRGELREGTGEILDLDEGAYRDGRWTVRMYATAKTLVEPHLVPSGKTMLNEVTEASVRAELSAHFSEVMDESPDTLFFLGPGSTIHGIATSLGIDKTLLGIDAVLARTVIARDVNEAQILYLLDRHRKAKIVVSPIGAQGFVLGRGNLPVSPAVLRRVGTGHLIIVATPGKLASTPVLRVDTGDPDLDREIRDKGYLFVVVGYRTSKVHPIQG